MTNETRKTIEEALMNALANAEDDLFRAKRFGGSERIIVGYQSRVDKIAAALAELNIEPPKEG